MKTLFSTTAVHPRDRFDYWHEVACRAVVDHDSKPENRRTFEAELEQGAIGPLGVVVFHNSPMSVWHTMSHVSRENTDELLVSQQTEGVLALEQNSRTVQLQPGDITLIDPRLPYTGKFSAASKTLVIRVPRRLLEARVGQVQEMTACSIKPLAGECSLTSGFLGTLPGCSGSLSPVAEALVANQVLDLVAISLARATAGGWRPRISSARSLALIKLRAAVEGLLVDPALDPTKAAAAAGMSVRYANSLLAEESTSIARFIQTRRLARCREALEDFSQVHRSVSEIAYGWGFSDMTHFGRKFRAAFGMLPSEYRRTAARGTDKVNH